VDPTTHDLPSKAKIVIVGAGAQGSAIAYKLAQKGLGEDTVIIDQGELGGGSTWHSAGLISQLANSAVETRLSALSRQLYLELEEKGYYTGWKQTGSLYLAQTRERLHHYKRLKSASVLHKIECEIVTPDRVKELCPLVQTDDLKGALWVPGDGVANPFEICRALASLAAGMGVRVVPNCALQNVLVGKDGSVKGVKTNKGTIECRYFVNCAGYWARSVGYASKPKVQVPLHPAEHYYLHTKPPPAPASLLLPNTPVVHDPDSNIYFRENEGRFLAGGFEPVAKPTFDAELPSSSKSKDLTVDWDHFHVLLEALLHRVPAMRDAVLERLTNGPEAFSPDGNWILGQAPEIRNYLVAAAMRSIGIGAAGGVGQVIASYITEGKAPFDIANLDIQRFLPAHNNRKFLRDRVTEVPSRFYAIPYPFPEFRTGRALRTSPIFPKLRDSGARFNQVMGYERAMYFKKDEPLSGDLNYLGMGGLDAPKPESELAESERRRAGREKKDDSNTLALAETPSFFKPPWFDAVRDEFLSTRKGVTMCDYSSFAKFDIWSAGAEAVDYLQYMCSNDVDVPVGSIVHTGMHNCEGGYENDCSVARLAFNRFMLMSPSIQQMKSFTWMKKHLPSDGSVYVQDVTSLYTTLCIMGPKSPDLMAKLTDADLKSFSFYTCRHLDIACAPDILVMNMTHTGELGYVMYIPSEFALHVFDEIMGAGRGLGIKHCGYYAMHALRIEKFFAFWGQDLDSQTTPYECGRSFRVKMENKNNHNKDLDFIGRQAMERQKKEGIKKILVMLLLDSTDHDIEVDPWPWGGEPIFRDGRFAGSVTTAAYGFSINKHVCLGFIHNYRNGNDTEEGGDGDGLVTSQWVKSGQYEIEIGGLRFPVTAKLTAPVLPSVSKRYQAKRAGMRGGGMHDVPTRHEVVLGEDFD